MRKIVSKRKILIAEKIERFWNGNFQIRNDSNLFWILAVLGNCYFPE